MNTPISWFHPEFSEKDMNRVIAVINSGYINDGEVTRKLEERMAKFLNIKHCVAVTSGTAAITLALIGLGIGYGDEVIVPDFTFIATANAVKLTGADVRLVDIDPERLTIDPEKIIENINSKTKAILPVDVNGRGADYKKITKIAKDYGLKIVCDSAEALGSKYKGNYLGTYGDAGCFSFSPNKTITTGQGGMITTNNSQLHHKLRELKDQGRRFQGSGGDDLHPVVGYNFKLTNLQAAIGLAQFDLLENRLEKAKRRDKMFYSLLRDCPNISFPKNTLDGEEVLQWTDIFVENRHSLEKKFESVEIGFRNFWFPIHTQSSYLCNDRQFNKSDWCSKKGLWLSSNFSISDEEIKYVADAVKESVSKKAI